jgi:hypothetical protein
MRLKRQGSHRGNIPDLRFSDTLDTKTKGDRKMATNNYNFGDPRKLFELWKELTGEDLLNDEKDHLDDHKDLPKKAKEAKMKC